MQISSRISEGKHLFSLADKKKGEIERIFPPIPSKGFFFGSGQQRKSGFLRGKRDYGSSILCLSAPLAALTVIINCSF